MVFVDVHSCGCISTVENRSGKPDDRLPRMFTGHITDDTAPATPVSLHVPQQKGFQQSFAATEMSLWMEHNGV